MRDWRILVGLLIGVAAAGLVLAAMPDAWLIPGAREARNPEHGPMLSDCDGALEELVIHYLPAAAPIVETAYRDFLRQLPHEVTVHVVCPDSAAFDDLRARVGPVSCRLRSVTAGHAMTCWSRDRWLALAPARAGAPAVLLHPSEEDCAAVWPARAGDARVAADLAAAMPGHIAAWRSALAFDGGDFVADGETAFVAPHVAESSVGPAVSSPLELRRALERALGVQCVLLTDAPPHHAGMFMMLAGGRVAVVGDPSLARRLLGESTCPLADADFSEATQKRFDAVAARCAAAGYRVERMPVLPGRDGRTYLTYVNVILDERDGRRTVYLPVYRGADLLNDAAAATWRRLGCDVRRVDCTGVYPHFGSLRCLVSVLRRSND